jgi:hypothetical protein
MGIFRQGLTVQAKEATGKFRKFSPKGTSRKDAQGAGSARRFGFDRGSAAPFVCSATAVSSAAEHP